MTSNQRSKQLDSAFCDLERDPETFNAYGSEEDLDPYEKVLEQSSQDTRRERLSATHML